MENKLRKSKKRGASKSDRDDSKSAYASRPKRTPDLNQYEQDKVTNAESDNDLRIYDNQKPDEFDIEREEERETRRKIEEANPPDETVNEEAKN